MDEHIQPVRAEQRQFRLSTVFWIMASVATVFSVAHMAAPDAMGRVVFASWILAALFIMAIFLSMAYREGETYAASEVSRELLALASDLGYAPEAINFVRQIALAEGANADKRQLHALVQRRAQHRFGQRAPSVVRSWGVHGEDDVDLILDGLVKSGLLD